MSEQQWEIRTEPFSGLSVNPDTGHSEKESGTRVRYRRRGSRGRFEVFVLVGHSTANMQEVVSLYEKRRQETRLARR
jgi:DNA integrity scanning protein DisA with diadenylate cyclase activity